MFSTKFFKDVGKLKKVVKNVTHDIKRVAGEVRIIFALKSTQLFKTGLLKIYSLAKALFKIVVCRKCLKLVELPSVRHAH